MYFKALKNKMNQRCDKEPLAKDFIHNVLQEQL